MIEVDSLIDDVMAIAKILKIDYSYKSFLFFIKNLLNGVDPLVLSDAIKKIKHYFDNQEL